MAKFQWEATTRTGEKRKGAMEAETAEIVENRLRADGLTTNRVKKEAKQINISFGSGVPPKDLQIFTRQLATMIDAGLPLVQCLDILGTQEEDKHFAAVILQTRTDVESGASLADAMRKHPKTFDPLFTNMIAAGEAGGILDTILKRLATYIEKAVKLAGQVKSAMIYPIAVLVIAGGVVGVILWKVIPTFAALFSGLGADLPLATRIVIGMSDNLVRFFPFLFVGAGAIGYGFKQYYSTPRGRRGSMQREFKVYGRLDKPCDRCGTPIEKTRAGGRGTWYCPNCQPPPDES